MHDIEKLRGVMERIFGSDIDTSNFGPESRLKEDIGMNSISMLYVAIAIEQEYGVEFNNEDLTSLKTVQDVLNRIGKKD